MKNHFRESDVYGRLGGDEFVALLSSISVKEAEESIERFKRSLIEHNQSENRGYDISFSSGIIEYSPKNHTSIEDLIIEGDTLMYESKK